VGSVVWGGRGMGDEAVDTWGEAFEAFHARFAPFFFREEVRARSARYLRGLLGPVERKNGWQLAEATGERDPQGMQRLLYEARWDAGAARDELERFVAERFGDADGIFVLDETGFVKKGSKSVGVQRQYSGTAGKVENCQVAVFLAYVSRHGHALLDRALYLPQEWAADAERRREAAVPDELAFRTKPALGWAMLEHARALGVPGRWVLGDTVYGQDPGLRARLEALAPACHYLLAVPASTAVWTRPEAGAPVEAEGAILRRAWTAHTAAGLVAMLAPEAWRPLTVAAGAKGPRRYEWAAVRAALGEQGWPGPERWLLARRALGDPTDRAYYASNAPADTPLEAVARAAGARWPIEQCFEEAKGEAGLDQYEVRQWPSWHRHVTLSMLAHSFLADLRREAGKKPAGPGAGERAGARQRPGGAAPAGDHAAAAAPVAGGAAGLVVVAATAPGRRAAQPLPPPSCRAGSPPRHTAPHLRL
jgi:SRSO17 transposase